MTRTMGEAYRLLRSHGPDAVAYGGDQGLFVADGQVWMHWRTAEALERRHLVTIDRDSDESWTVTLVEGNAA